tara:strand:+ start:73 stop:303 length:231 start_codon:yes stop_codon:yes gene_type:complete
MKKGTFFVKVGEGDNAPTSAFPFDTESPDFIRQKLRFVTFIRRHQSQILFVTFKGEDGNWYHPKPDLGEAFTQGGV